MNDDLVVQKILTLLENNTAFIGYALNGGIGTKINVRNTETGKTIQAISINVDSTGEVLVVKDSEDNQYKAVTFKTAEKVSERIIQLRKTKPTDDKKTLEYTDSDIEVFYLFVKLIDTGSPVSTQLTSTWIRKGSSCTQFVGAYERCNYASKETIGGVSYTGLPYKTYETLKACLDDDLGRDAKTPHGTKDENGVGLGWRIYSTKMTAQAEQNLKGALESHDAYYNTNYRKLFGYGSILECSGAMYVQGWQVYNIRDPQTNEITGAFFGCDFSYLPGYTNDCSSAQQAAGYCDNRGFIGSKAPLFGQEAPGQPSLNQVDNSWGHQYGWVNLPYEFKYKRHFPYNYSNGQNAQGSFLIIEGLTDDQQPTIPEGYFLWVPGCPSGGNGGPYDGSGGNRFPDGEPEPQKRDMKLSTHKAEIWLGSSKKEEAIKLYELGASDLFSGMYNAFIYRSDETQVDIENRLNRGPNFTPTAEDVIKHNINYQTINKNIIDLRLNPKVWTYVIDNIVKTAGGTSNYFGNDEVLNFSLQSFVHHLYNRTLNLSIVDKKLQVIHLKIGLLPANILNNTDCKGRSGSNFSVPGNDNTCSQSWQYQKTITIKVKDWKILSTQNNLDTTDLENNWNVDYISRKYLTSFGDFNNAGDTGVSRRHREAASKLLLRHDGNTGFSNLVAGGHYEQYNYSTKNLLPLYFDDDRSNQQGLYVDYINLFKPVAFGDQNKRIALGTFNWWELWDKTLYNKKTKRLNSIVGYEQNYYQILTSAGLDPNLNPNYQTNNLGFGIYKTAYFNYIPTRPLNYLKSNIREVRNNGEGVDRYSFLKNRDTILSKSGYLFYFSDESTYWHNTFFNRIIDLPYLYPGEYYETGFGTGNTNLQSRNIFRVATESRYNYALNHGGRFDTNDWKHKLWAQLVYDGKIKVDVESYKNVEFNFYTPANKYIKYSHIKEYTNSEYSFTDEPTELTTIDTVLSPGTQDLFKDVTIKKPTNVDLDPNYSFLVYLYPFVEVTKKKKTI